MATDSKSDRLVQVEITDAMIDAGVGVLEGFGGISDASELASRVYIAMRGHQVSSRGLRSE